MSKFTTNGLLSAAQPYKISCSGSLCQIVFDEILKSCLNMPEPYCLAMVLCDAVHRDQATGKFTLLGTFSTLGSSEFPATVRFCVYFAITDGLGPTKISLRLVDSESAISGATDRPAWEAPAALEFNFEDPLTVLESVAVIQTQLPAPGLYHCELTAGDELLMSRRVLAIDGNEELEND